MDKIKITKNWNILAEEVYRPFGMRNLADLDFSDEAKLQTFVWESKGRRVFQEAFGISDIPSTNGFNKAKWGLDITVSEIIAEIKSYSKKYMRLHILTSFFAKDVLGNSYPEWWLNTVIPKEILDEFDTNDIKKNVELHNEAVTDDSVVYINKQLEIIKETQEKLRRQNQTHILWTKSNGWQWNNWRGILRYVGNITFSKLRLKHRFI